MLRATGQLACLCVILVGAGCSYDEHVKVQNQLDEPIDFAWWEDAPDEGFVRTVRVPARTTVRFRSGSFTMKDGKAFLGIPPTCGLSYKTVDTGRELLKPSALAPFDEAEWRETHIVGKRKRRLTLFFVVTAKDIVLVLEPREVVSIDEVK